MINHVFTVSFCWRLLAFSVFWFLLYILSSMEKLTYAGRVSSWPLCVCLAVPCGCIWYSVAIVARVCCCTSHSEARVQNHVTIGWAAQAWTCQCYKDASNRIDTELRSNQYLGARVWVFVYRLCDSLPLIYSWVVQMQDLLLLAVNEYWKNFDKSMLLWYPDKDKINLELSALSYLEVKPGQY